MRTASKILPKIRAASLPEIRLGLERSVEDASGLQ